MSKLSSCYFITVDAHAEECFFERVETGAKLGLLFEISEGGFLDIDVKITGPDGKVIYEGDRETSGKYTFASYAPGPYTYCFSNKMSTMTPKVVMFNMEIDAPAKEEHKDDSKPQGEEDKLEDMIKQLGSILKNVKLEQEYMGVRDRIHRSINEATNSRVMTWALSECFVLLAMVIGQIWYLKRFFEVRRIV